MAKLKLSELSEESVISCPNCEAIYTQGRVLVEVEYEGQVFVFAELTCCCSEPVPIPVLFDSHKSARKVLDRLGESIRRKTSPFFQLPLVSKAKFFG